MFKCNKIKRVKVSERYLVFLFKNCQGLPSREGGGEVNKGGAGGVGLLKK